MAAHPAILPVPLYYRHLEATKIRTLQMEGSYSSEIPELTPRMVEELTWWTSRVSGFNGRPLRVEKWGLTIFSEASKMGWGLTCDGINTGGTWTTEEAASHINYLELLAAFFALKSFASQKENSSILLRLDKDTAIAFINRMGGTH